MIYEIFSKSNTYRRKEFIDTEKNTLFGKCRNARDVELAFVAYWELGIENKGLEAIAIPCPTLKSRGGYWGIKRFSLP